MKKVIMCILSVVLIMILPSSIIKAEENYTINGYVITYNGKDYDLSTSQGNYELNKPAFQSIVDRCN